MKSIRNITVPNSWVPVLKFKNKINVQFGVYKNIMPNSALTQKPYLKLEGRILDENSEILRRSLGEIFSIIPVPPYLPVATTFDWICMPYLFPGAPNREVRQAMKNTT